MTASSGYFNGDFDRIASQSRTEAEDTSSAPGPRARVNSNDIVGFGGLFRDTRDAYPPQLELSEEEDGARQPQAQTVVGSSTCPPTSDRPSGQPRSRSTPALVAPQTPRTAPRFARLNTEPYLCQEDFDQFWERRSRSRRGVNSRHRSDASTYYSATDYPASVATEATEQDDDDTGEGRPSTASPPYFTPGHTPPAPSEATTEYDDSEGKSPVSPGPFSSYNTYNAQHGETAIAQVRQHFQG